MSGQRLTRFTWERAVISERGPVNPTTRHVLLTLATHFGRDGRAWPSIKTLSDESRLSERAVFGHLDIAVGEGWIGRQSVRADGLGKAWRRNVYSMAMPAPAGVAPRAEPMPVGLAPRAAPQAPECVGHAPGADGHAPGALGHAPGDSLVMHHVPTNNVLNTSLENSNNTSGEKLEKIQSPEQPRKGNGNGGLQGNEPQDDKGWAEFLNIRPMPGEHKNGYAIRLAGGISAYRGRARAKEATS